MYRDTGCPVQSMLLSLLGNRIYLIIPAFLPHFRTLIEIEPRKPVNRINAKVLADVVA